MDNFIEEDKIKEIIILNGQKFEALEAYNVILKSQEFYLLSSCLQKWIRVLFTKRNE